MSYAKQCYAKKIQRKSRTLKRWKTKTRAKNVAWVTQNLHDFLWERHFLRAIFSAFKVTKAVTNMRAVVFLLIFSCTPLRNSLTRETGYIALCWLFETYRLVLVFPINLFIAQNSSILTELKHVQMLQENIDILFLNKKVRKWSKKLQIQETFVKSQPAW